MINSSNHRSLIHLVQPKCRETPGWMIKRSCVRRVGPNLPTGLENCDALVQKFPEMLSEA